MALFSPLLLNSYRSFPPTPRIICSASTSPPHHGGRTRFMDFPYVSPSHKHLMVDIVSTVETRLDSLLKPCTLPADVQSYHNETETSHGALHLRSGVQSSQIDFMLGTNWLHSELPSGGALNITNLLAYLNSSTDAPNLVIELIQTSPTSMVVIIDCPSRKSLVITPDYLKTFYEDTQMDQYRRRLEKLSEVKPYISSSLFVRSFFSPTAVMVSIETQDLDEIIKPHVALIAKEVLETWLDVCAFSQREVDESERDYLKKRDGMSKNEAIEIDLGSSLPRLDFYLTLMLLKYLDMFF